MSSLFSCRSEAEGGVLRDSRERPTRTRPRRAGRRRLRSIFFNHAVRGQVSLRGRQLSRGRLLSSGYIKARWEELNASVLDSRGLISERFSGGAALLHQSRSCAAIFVQWPSPSGTPLPPSSRGRFLIVGGASSCPSDHVCVLVPVTMATMC